MKVKKNVKIAILTTLLAGVLATLFFTTIKPRMELRELARETCDEIDGAMVIVVAGVINKASNKAERLGFEKQELGEEMREQCPGVVAALEDWARKN
jgi:hypothetical protein